MCQNSIGSFKDSNFNVNTKALIVRYPDRIEATFKFLYARDGNRTTSWKGDHKYYTSKQHSN